MQKKLIAVAVAGLLAAPAFAQTHVTIYGRGDIGIFNRDTCFCVKYKSHSFTS